jgi:hypothetical protein
MSIVLTDEDRNLVAALAEERPGVSRHRVGRAIWRLGRRVYETQVELLDDELAEMDREAAARRLAMKERGR